MECLVVFLQLCHLTHCSGSTLRCCCARSAIRTSLQRSSSWPHLSQEMMYVFCSFPFTATLSFFDTMSESVNKEFITVHFFCRKTMMRKLRPTSTTWSRPISYARHVRQQWSTTSNTKTANFEPCS